MKLGTLIVTMFCLVSLAGCADMKIAEHPEKPIEVVIDVPGKNKNQIFSAAKSWVAETSMARMSTVDSDKDSGRIVVKGNGDMPCEGGMDCMLHKDYLIRFTLRIDSKDAKFKMTFLDLIIVPPTSIKRDPYPIAMQRDVDAANKGAQAMSKELLSYATKQATKNW